MLRVPYCGKFLLLVLLTVVTFSDAAQCQVPSRPNVLMIAVDDLNHWVGHLGRNPQTRTPNIDRLAAMGTAFTNAHCAAPVCNPSRAALLSGMRPGTTGIYDNSDPFRKVLTSDQSLVTQFRKAGYETLGMGKLWHGGLGFPEQWTSTGGIDRDGKEGVAVDDRSIANIRFGIVQGGDEAVADTQIADYGIAELNKSHDKPFFLTVGFHKPHMPWNVPQKYYDLHPLDQIELPPAPPGDLNDVPPAGVEMARPQRDHAAVLKSGRWKEAVQAYLAAISYLDGQVGRVLDALEKSPYAANTIICLWGDHGWHLGEKQHWRKFALWEEATRAPLIWVVPGLTNPGSVCSRPVDFMSIYPTLCDLAEIPLPAHVEGKSIRSLLSDSSAPWNDIALTTYGQNNHAVRSDRWRYIRYANGDEELYDHSVDPYERKNLASSPELSGVKQELAGHFPMKNIVPVKVSQPERRRPNIVWMIVEDMSAHFSCYGETTIRTPQIDQLATMGTRFSRAFTTAPICSTSRSALITGRYQTSMGAQNHRSGVPGHEIHLPAGVELVPTILRRAGYHTNNLTVESFLRNDSDVRLSPHVDIAKTDYNFEWDESATCESTHWAARAPGKPFFVQVQLRGGKLRGHGDAEKWPQQVLRDLGSVTDPAAVMLPPWLPDDPVIRKDWAQYLDTVRYTDREVGQVIQRLKDAEVYDNTVVFLMTDHGISHVRTKQFLYDGGIHVPLIVHGPGIPAGTVRNDLVEHIDLAAASLGLAGIQVPAAMHARDIFSSEYRPREFVFAARDRADETVDLIRSVRDTRWKYIYNGFPGRPYLQPNNYKDNKPIVKTMRLLSASGKLNDAQSLIMAATRPRDELYDTLRDPEELHNLAADPTYSAELQRMKKALSEWQTRTLDAATPESEDVYRIEVMGRHAEAGRNSSDSQYHRNVELMLRWMHERPLNQ
jgi:arylsulfatase A-like enzyme